MVSRSVRPYVVAYAYLLGGYTGFRFIGLVSRVDMAYRVFGHEPVDVAIEQILAVLRGWGYIQGGDQPRQRSMICHLLLCNSSPYLADLSDQIILKLQHSVSVDCRNNSTALHCIHRALAALGHIPPPPAPRSHSTYIIEPAIAEWRGWIDRWYDTSPLTPKVRRVYRSLLTQTGRWLAAENIPANSPELWTRQICAAWVARVDRLQAGDYAHVNAHLHLRAGQPLLPASKAGYLSATRIFFRDCQDWEWIKPRFDPRVALV